MTFLFLVTPNWAPATELIYGDFGKALKKHMVCRKGWAEDYEQAWL